MKTRGQQIINEYRELIKQIPQLMELSGLTDKHIQEQMQLKEATYFRRKKAGSWSTDELEKLIKIIEGKKH